MVTKTNKRKRPVRGGHVEFARTMGRTAYMNGLKAAPMVDRAFMAFMLLNYRHAAAKARIALLEAWTGAWHKANVKYGAPVMEVNYGTA